MHTELAPALQVSAERDCIINNQTEGHVSGVCFKKKHANGIEALCSQTSNQSCRDLFLGGEGLLTHDARTDLNLVH